MPDGQILPRVYVTKWVFTQGVLVGRARICSDGMIELLDRGPFRCYAHKPHWHETWPEAAARIEKMRQAKIKSLRKSLAKIESFKIEEPSEGPK